MKGREHCDGDSLHELRRIGHPQEDSQGLLVDARVQWAVSQRISDLCDYDGRVVEALGLATRTRMYAYRLRGNGGVLETGL